MSVTRANAATYLHSQFANLATEVGQTTTDAASTGYGPDIDAALRMMSVAEDDIAAATVDDGDRRDFYALCDYTCLSRMARRLATKVDTGGLVAEGDRQKIFENVKALLDDAAELISELGYAAGNAGGDSGAGTAAAWGYVDYNADWVEPACSVTEWS